MSIENLTGKRDLSGLTGSKTNLTGMRPNLAALTGKTPPPVEDPLKNTEYTGNLEQDTAAELTDLQKAYRDRAKQEADRFKAATDSEYWVAVCFTSREEKEAFLTKHGLTPLGDKYLDGNQVDQALSNR